MPTAVPRHRHLIPARLEPQLCTPARRPPEGDDWLHEIKYDGWRLLARKQGRDVRLLTRGGHDLAARMPQMAEAVRSLPARSVWLDGELVCLRDDGFPDFGAVGERVRRSAEGRLFYHVWDVPWADGRDLTKTPLLDRKARLAALVSGAPMRIRYTAHVIGRGSAFLAQVDALDLEGMVSKRVDARYRPGERTPHWLKTKCWRSYDVIVTAVERDAAGHVEALGVATEDGDTPMRRGRVELGLWTERAREVEVGSRIVIRALPCAAGEWLRHAMFVRVL